MSRGAEASGEVGSGEEGPREAGLAPGLWLEPRGSEGAVFRWDSELDSRCGRQGGSGEAVGADAERRVPLPWGQVTAVNNSVSPCPVKVPAVGL